MAHDEQDMTAADGDAILISERYVRGILDQLVEGCQIIGFDWRCKYLNDATAVHAGSTKEALLGRPLTEMFPGIEKTDAYTLMQRAMTERVTVRGITRHAVPGSTEQRFDVRAVPAPEGILVFVQQIAEFVVADSGSRESGISLGTLLGAIPIPVFYKDTAGRYLGANKAFEAFHGISVDDLTGKTDLDLSTLDDARINHERDLELCITGTSQQYEARALNADGERRDVILKKAVFRDTAGAVTGMIGALLDITDHKRFEESQRTLHTIYQSVNDGIMLADADTHRFLDANQTMARMLGYTREELLSLSLEDIHPPDRLPEVKAAFEDQLSGKNPLARNTPVMRKDGSVFNVDINAVPLRLSGCLCLLGVFRDITERLDTEAELNRYRDGLEDMVAKYKLELADAQTQLVRREKLAVLGKLTGGVSHELRNPLSAIKNAAYFLNIAITGDDPEIRDSIAIISKEINTAERIIGSMLDFARPRQPERERIDIDSLIDSTLEGCAIPPNVRVVRSSSGDIPRVLIDTTQISRVFANIITNAVQAMPQGGELSITTAFDDTGRVRIAFTDSGVGIAEENIAQMFEPLFTTKAKGIGLGLAISQSMIERHGGAITVTSTEGEGSTFTVTLPVTPREDGIS